MANNDLMEDSYKCCKKGGNKNGEWGGKDDNIFRASDLKFFYSYRLNMINCFQGSLMTGIKLPNCFGRGEKFQVKYFLFSEEGNNK